MGFPVTINGNTYTEADMEGYGYKTNLPSMVNDVGTVAGDVAADAAQVAADAITVAADKATAVAAKNSAEAAWDSFDDRYLGSKAVAPTLDNDGNALTEGAIYWDSVGKLWKAWNGSAWVAVYNPSTGEIPTQTGNNGKFLTTDGSNMSWAAARLSNIVEATTATTLTSTGTLLKITPTSYGVAVTLPDATTCSEGGPLHIIDNKGAYPVKVLNNSGTLLGFIYGGVVSHISLIDNSTAAGTWSVENSELVGASAQLLTTIWAVHKVLAIDSDREIILYGNTTNANIYGVVYNKSTNTFGNATLIRTASLVGGNVDGVLAATDKVLVVSCTYSATAFEAVVLSISGTTITVNTAATATLSANISSFADGCGLIAVGSDFVTSYTVATPAAQIRAISVSGTTVTIGSATVLDGTAGGLIAATGDKVIAASHTATTTMHVKPYTVSGSSLSAGTGATDTLAGNISTIKLTPLGARWVAMIANGLGNDARCSVVSLSGTTVTLSSVNMGLNANILDAIVVTSSKLLVLGNASSNNANILTDTAGTASAGTAITLDANTSRVCLYASGNNVYVNGSPSPYTITTVDCSGASPVLAYKQSYTTGIAAAEITAYSASNSVLNRAANAVYGTDFASLISISVSQGTSGKLHQIKSGVFTTKTFRGYTYAGSTFYRGKSDSERWQSDGTTAITKIELATGALS